MITNADLIDVITDPDMGGGFITYARILEVVNDKGRAEHSEVIYSTLANVQPAPGKEREMLPEGDRNKAAILIFTPAALTAGDGETVQADRVHYHTGTYRVSLAEPWLEHGEFTKAIAVLEEQANG